MIYLIAVIDHKYDTVQAKQRAGEVAQLSLSYATQELALFAPDLYYAGLALAWADVRTIAEQPVPLTYPEYMKFLFAMISSIASTVVLPEFAGWEESVMVRNQLMTAYDNNVPVTRMPYNIIRQRIASIKHSALRS